MSIVVMLYMMKEGYKEIERQAEMYFNHIKKDTPEKIIPPYYKGDDISKYRYRRTDIDYYDRVIHIKYFRQFNEKTNQPTEEFVYSIHASDLDEWIRNKE